MNILNMYRWQLADYVRKQIAAVVPLPDASDSELIDEHLDEALQRLRFCISKIKMWAPDQFDVLHSTQYCTFLYFLANTIWKASRSQGICTKLFLLNKALNAIDCFYEVELPEVFFIGHSVGIVLAKATYGNYLVIYQNSTVGKNHGIAPVIEEGVVLYPNSSVIGRCLVRTGSVISQGTSVINQDTLAHSLVFRGSGRELVFKQNRRPAFTDFFRCD